MAKVRKKAVGRVKLSRNIYRDMFACNCGCGLDTVDANLVIVLQRIINAFGNRPIFVTSGNRCKHANDNSKPPGAKGSMHLRCKAVDFYFPEHGDMPEVKGFEIAKVINSLFGDILYYYILDGSYHGITSQRGRVCHIDVGNA